MNRYAVMGSPIQHSHSPTLHLAAFDFLGLSAEYAAVEKTAIDRIDLADYKGLSLTMPLKNDAFNIADSHDEESEVTGVCNTLLISEERALGLNTDVYGIAKSVEQVPKETVEIIGNGATAKSAAYALRESKISFTGRNAERVRDITLWAESLGITVQDSEDVDLVIDTTPAAARTHYKPHRVVLDVAYNSDRNKNSESLISGLEMLLHQAVLQSVVFNEGKIDSKIDREQLTSVMREALQTRVGEWSHA